MNTAQRLQQLRKEKGMSQEELAEKMNVTRQAVSKWESAQTIPDVEKILAMSRLFGVTTDYLMKEELEAEEFLEVPEDTGTVRRVSMEEANEFLEVKRQTAKPIAAGVFLCIISPVTLMVLSTAAEMGRFAAGEAVADAIGLSVLLVLVAAAVSVFIICGMKTKRFEYLEHEIIDTEYGVTGMVKERQKRYHSTYVSSNVVGSALCIMAAIPLFLGMAVSSDDYFEIWMVAALLLMVGTGCVFLITAGINQSSMEKLLQEGDYTRQKKSRSPVLKAVIGAYWLVVTAIYLTYSLRTWDWRNTWIVWPVAGVLYAAVNVVLEAFERRER